MLKKRNKLGKMILIIMGASMLSSVNAFAKEDGNLNKEVITKTFENYQALKENSELNFDFDTATGTITKYKGSDSNVIIPSEINGIKVTVIGDRVFTENTNITSVEIPDGVTSIGAYSFYQCSELTKITIPDSVTSINGVKSFSYPRIQVFYVKSERVKQLLIDKAKIDESKIVLDNESLVSESGFEFDKTTGTITKYNGSDTEVVIPSKINGVKVTNIGKGAFTTLVGNGGVIPNDSLTSVEIPNGVTSIGDYAFTDCVTLTNIVIPNSVTSIGEKAFYKCTRVSNIIIPESITSIGKSAFSWGSNSVGVFHVESERVKQLLISASAKENKIVLDNKSSSESKSTETTKANNSTQVAESKEASNTLKWEKNSDGTWKLTKGGIMQSGWQQVNGKWYLMNSNGIMQSGWQPANGKWYYLNTSGEMASNTTINGYKLGSDGAWIE